MKDVASAEDETAMRLAIAKVNSEEQQAMQRFDVVMDRFLGDNTEIHKTQTFFIHWKPIRDEVIELVQKGKHQQAQAITKGKGAEYVGQLEVMMASLIHFAYGKASAFYDDSNQRFNHCALKRTECV